MQIAVSDGARCREWTSMPRWRLPEAKHGVAVLALLLAVGVSGTDMALAGDGDTSTQSAQVSIRVAQRVAVTLAEGGRDPLPAGNLTVPFFTGPALLTWHGGPGNDGTATFAGCDQPIDHNATCESYDIGQRGTTVVHADINLIPDLLLLNLQEDATKPATISYVLVSAIP
ncbi:MAG: hypothetical protein O2910_08655 [Proteobacteria bacterium]|nr:hypothetical protein [Pseudomonadota bacterium]